MTVQIVPGPVDNSTSGAPVNGHPQHPGRQVNTNSRIAAYLRHAGLAATDVAGEGPWVTMAEAEAEAARRGITVELADPLPPLAPELARAYVRRMQVLGAHLMRLSAGSKRPVDSAWQHAPALTEDEATEWVGRGENLGINLLRSGPNGWAVLDAENSVATAILVSAGLIPTAVTANAQDSTSEKHGGCHVWMQLPAGFDPATLTSTLQLQLDGGGLIDILVGTRYAVAPGTVLDSAPGKRYEFASVGAAMKPEVWAEAAPWLLDGTAPAPDVPGIEPLLGSILPKQRTKRTPRPDADLITQQIDEIPWGDWLQDDPRVQILGVDGACGCSVFHWAGASTQRSGILHDGCEYGSGVHAFSGTLISILGREHCSRLQFAAWLRGREGDFKEVAREFGVMMGGARPTGWTAADLARMASGPQPPDLRIVSDDDTDDDDDDTDGGADDEAPTVSGPATPTVPRIGTAGAGAPTSSAPTSSATTSSAPTNGATALEPEPPVGAASFVETSEPVEEDTGMALFRQIREIDASGFWETVPILSRIAKAADSHGVGRWGLVGAVLPRIVCSVPPFVRFLSASGTEAGQEGGGSLNLFVILTGPPEEGKTEVIKLSKLLVPLPAHASTITNGTGEGIVKSFSYTKKADKTKAKEVADEPADSKGPLAQPGSSDGGVAVPMIGSATPAKNSGYETVHITDTVMLTAGEIGGMIAEMKRQGTKATNTYRSAWMGEELGTTTGEIERRTYLPDHTYRFCSLLGAQVDLDVLGPIFAEGKLGSPQRFLFLPVQTKKKIGDPVQSLKIPEIDWYDGHAPASATAELVKPHPPVYIGRPLAADREMEAHRAARDSREHLAYSVAEVARRADDDDNIEDIRGHELFHQLKIAQAMALGDGLRVATDEYWFAAQVLMNVRELIQTTLMKVFNMQRDVTDRKNAKSQGRKQAESKRAEAEAKGDHLREVATRITDILRELGEPSSEAKIFKKLTKSHVGTAAEAIAELVHEGIIELTGHNTHGHGLYWFKSESTPLAAR